MATHSAYTSTNNTQTIWSETFFLYTEGGYTYPCASMPCWFHSLITSTQTFRFFRREHLAA